MKNEELVGLAILLLLSIIGCIITIAMGQLFTRPLELLPSLLLGLSCIKEIQKIKNTWNLIWLFFFIVVGIGYVIILLTYGDLITKLITLFSPLYLSWIGIQKLRNKDSSNEISHDNM